MFPNGYESCRIGHHFDDYAKPCRVDDYYAQATAYTMIDEAHHYGIPAEKVYSFQVTLNGTALEAEDITLGQAQELIKKFTEMGATEFVLTPESTEE